MNETGTHFCPSMLAVQWAASERMRHERKSLTVEHSETQQTSGTKTQRDADMFSEKWGTAEDRRAKAREFLNGSLQRSSLGPCSQRVSIDVQSSSSESTRASSFEFDSRGSPTIMESEPDTETTESEAESTSTSQLKGFRSKLLGECYTEATPSLEAPRSRVESDWDGQATPCFGTSSRARLSSDVEGGCTPRFGFGGSPDDASRAECGNQFF